LSVDVNVIKNVVNDCINEGFFNRNLYGQYGILTSKGIQKRYLEACTRRKQVSIIKEYCLIDPENYKNIVFEYINPVNADINPDKCDITLTKTPQSKVKESKVIEKEIDARARDNISQNKSQENFDTEIEKINNKAFEFGMSGVTPEFLEDTQMRLEEGTEPELIIKALSIGATNAHGNAGAKCRYAIRILQAWAAEGIKTLTQWEAKNAPKPKSRDKPITKTRAQEREEAFERAREEARRMLREEGVI
jgi:DnaD/phage-associated family protein